MNPETNSPLVRKVLLRQSIGSVRLVIGLFTITAALTNLLYDYYLPNLKDLDVLRWTIIGLGCVIFTTTYIRYKRGVIVTYFSFFLYLLTLLYVIAFAVINQFNPHAVTILILVVGASTVIINSLVYYGIQCFVIVIASQIVLSSTNLSNENMIGFLNLMIALSVFGIVLAVRLRLISSVNSSHSSLEKLNVLSIVANK